MSEPVDLDEVKVGADVLRLVAEVRALREERDMLRERLLVAAQALAAGSERQPAPPAEEPEHHDFCAVYDEPPEPCDCEPHELPPALDPYHHRRPVAIATTPPPTVEERPLYAGPPPPAAQAPEKEEPGKPQGPPGHKFRPCRCLDGLDFPTHSCPVGGGDLCHFHVGDGRACGELRVAHASQPSAPTAPAA